MRLQQKKYIYKENTINILNIGICVVEYILALLIILNCNSVYERVLYQDYKFAELIVIFTLILFIALSLQANFTKYTFKKLIIFINILWLYLIIFSIINVPSDKMIFFIVRYIVFIPCMVACFCLYKEKGKSFEFLYKISNVIYIIAIISLIMWVLCSFLNMISSNTNIIVDWGKIRTFNGYWNIYFETQNITFFSYEGLRNTAIFTEAPMFNLCLIIALLIELFMKNEIKKIRVFILLIAVVSTFSTTGLICCLIMMFLKFIYNNKIKNQYYIAIKFLFVIIISLIILMITTNILMDKSTTSSYSARLDDYIAGFKAWIDHPIFGNGYGRDLAIQKHMSYFRSNNLGFSNSIMRVLAEGGVWLFMVYMIPLIAYFRKKETNKNIFIVGVIFLILFTTTIFQDRFILLLFMSLGYSFILNGNK